MMAPSSVTRSGALLGEMPGGGHLEGIPQGSDDWNKNSELQ